MSSREVEEALKVQFVEMTFFNLRRLIPGAVANADSLHDTFRINGHTTLCATWGRDGGWCLTVNLVTNDRELVRVIQDHEEVSMVAVETALEIALNKIGDWKFFAK